MSARMRQTERAIFLVDAFPLDSLVAALALGVREAVLVFCPAQRSVAEALGRRRHRHPRQRRGGPDHRVTNRRPRGGC